MLTVVFFWMPFIMGTTFDSQVAVMAWTTWKQIYRLCIARLVSKMKASFSSSQMVRSPMRSSWFSSTIFWHQVWGVACGVFLQQKNRAYWAWNMNTHAVYMYDMTYHILTCLTFIICIFYIHIYIYIIHTYLHTLVCCLWLPRFIKQYNRLMVGTSEHSMLDCQHFSGSMVWWFG